jgi:hypothetical protein
MKVSKVLQSTALREADIFSHLAPVGYKIVKRFFFHLPRQVVWELASVFMVVRFARSEGV